MHRQAPLTVPLNLYCNQRYNVLAIALNFNQRSISWKSIQKRDRKGVFPRREYDESCPLVRSPHLPPATAPAGEAEKRE
jgi:hypothetical protein